MIGSSSGGLLAANLLSPFVLAFVLGVIAKRLGSNLSLPKDVYDGLSTYLLFAIGLKGGARLAQAPLDQLLAPTGAALALGVITPVVAFAVLRLAGGMSRVNAGAIAAHYGSVSAVTFIAAQGLVQQRGDAAEPFLPALLAIMEVPGLVVGLALGLAGANRGDRPLRQVLHEIVLGKTLVLLLGGLAIGAAVGPERLAPVQPFFEGLFPGALTLFLLELGVVAGARLGDLKRVGPFLLGFGTVIPIVHGVLGVLLGSWAGLSVGGATVMGAMAASASYIAAPPAVRLALPDANPTYYLTAVLAITFPFNLIVGIPLYYWTALWVAERMT